MQNFMSKKAPNFNRPKIRSLFESCELNLCRLWNDINFLSQVVTRLESCVKYSCPKSNKMSMDWRCQAKIEKKSKLGQKISGDRFLGLQRGFDGWNIYGISQQYLHILCSDGEKISSIGQRIAREIRSHLEFQFHENFSGDTSNLSVYTLMKHGTVDASSLPYSSDLDPFFYYPFPKSKKVLKGKIYFKKLKVKSVILEIFCHNIHLFAPTPSLIRIPSKSVIVVNST